MYLKIERVSYIIIEYVSGKTEVYRLKTKEQYKDILIRISNDIAHIEEVKIVDMTEEEGVC